MSASRSRGKRATSPPRRGTLDLVRELARLRDREPTRFPAAYLDLKETVPDLDHLLKVFAPPARTPSSTSPRPGSGSSSYSQLRSGAASSRRSPTAVPSFGSPLAGSMNAEGLGESLLDVSGISGIAGDNNDFIYNDSDLFLGGGGDSAGSAGGAGGAGAGYGGGVTANGTSTRGRHHRLDIDTTGGGNNGSVLGGATSPRWQQPGPGRTAAVDAALVSRAATLHLGGRGGEGVTPGQSRSPIMTDSFLLRNGGSGSGDGSDGLGVGRSGASARRGGGMGASGEWDAKAGESEDDEIQQLIAEAQPLSPEAVADQTPDVQDVRCVCLHQPVLLRGSQGRYLQVSKEEEEAEGDEEDFDDNASIVTAVTAISGEKVGGGAGGGGFIAGELKTLFGVNAEGTGTGDPSEVVFFVSASQRGDRGPVVYGQSVCIKSVHGKGKYLRVSSSGALAFARIHTGPAERWRVLPCRSAGGPAVAGGGGGGARKTAVRLGRFVRKGERIELEHTEYSGAQSGARTSLMMRPGDYGGWWEVAAGRREQYRGEEYESWEILPAGVPYLPPWRRNRSYLTRDFLLARPPKAPSRAVAKLFGIEPGDGVVIDYDHRRSGGGGGGELQRSRGEGAGWGRQGEGGVAEALPEAMQEQLLLDDLLYAMMGFAGRYIVVKGVGGSGSGGQGEAAAPPASLYDLEFAVNVDGDSIDQSLAYLAERVLPLCNNYVRVNRFASERGQYEFGKVAHALAAGVQRLLREYLVLVAQLESQLLQGKLSLQRLWFYVQPSMRTMESLEALTVELRDSKGGEMLRRLRALGGTGGGVDEASRQLYTFLLHQASAPYLEMLEIWIYHGNLNDQYGEFMIEQAEDVHKQDVGQDFNTRYWSGRYLLRPEHVIANLAGRQDKILTTGKYLNVVRECGRRVDCPLAGPIPADPGAAGEGLYLKVIDGAYGFASRCLMDLVVIEGQLLPRLESIKHYFLLDRGDFFEHLLDCAETELDKVIPQISVPRLESLLHLSVQMSSASQDPFKDDLGLEFAGRNLLKQLEMIHGHGGSGDPDALGGRAKAAAAAAAVAAIAASAMPSPSGAERQGGAEYAERIIQGTAELRGVEGLMMSFKVGWPVSLVLSKKSLTKYQLLFRHLFFAKHVQRLLSKNSWREHQDTKQLELKGLMMASYQLRHRMLHFMQNLVYYMMVEVIEPHWHHFMDDLKKLCALKGQEWPAAGGGSGGGRHGKEEGETGTLDDVLRRHEQFQDLCLKECLLTNIGLLKSLTRVMISCLHFGDQGGIFAAEREAQEAADREKEVEEAKEDNAAELLQRRRTSVGSGTGSVQSAGLGPRRSLSGSRRIEHLKRRSSSMRSALDTKRYKEYIQRSQEGFDASLQVFASHLWHDAVGHYHSHLNNLCARLDYNGFFSKTSRKMVP